MTNQFLSEVASLHVEIEDLGVVNENTEGTLTERGRALPEDLVEDNSVLLGESQELAGIGG